MHYEKTQLANGMTVITEAMPGTHTITLGLWFNVGSRDERSDQAGLTHFMEHMMFKGTPTRTPLDISMSFDELGAELNAFTSKEYTCYYARFVDDKLPDALEILADMVIRSEFSQEAIDTEREVVIEEIARSEDQPDDHVFELFTSSLMNGHPVGLPVLGTRERVGSYTHEDCVAFHRDHYHAGNLTLAAAGNVDHQALAALSAKLFATMPTGRKAQRALPEPQCVSGIFSKKQDIEQAHLVCGFPWYGVGDQRRFAGGVLTSMLGGSMSSRLFQEVREKRGLVYSIYATQACYQNAGMWCIYAGTRPSNLKEVCDLIAAELERIVSDPIDEAELTRNIDLICGQLALSQETTSSHMVRLGKRETLGLPIEPLEETMAGYRRVSAQDVSQLAAEMLSGDACYAVVSPYDENELSELITR